MNRVLKYAWYQLIVIIAAIVFAGISVWIIAAYWREKEFSVLIPLAPLVLVHLFKIFFPLKSVEITFDERDETIMSRATKISFMSIFYIFAAGCLIPVLVIGNGSIHVMYLGWLFFTAVILFRIVWSITVIIKYGRTGDNDNTDTVLKGEIA